VYCIDWGTPVTKIVTCRSTDRRRVPRGARFARRPHRGAKKTHVLGYCMAARSASHRGAARNSGELTTLALRCVLGGGLLAFWTRSKPSRVAAGRRAGQRALAFAAAQLHLLRPTLSLAKVVGAGRSRESDEFIDGFLALEKWGHDNVSLPGDSTGATSTSSSAETRCWTAGRPQRRARTLENIRCPLHVVSFEHDNIGPRAPRCRCWRGRAGRQAPPPPQRRPLGAASRARGEGSLGRRSRRSFRRTSLRAPRRFGALRARLRVKREWLTPSDAHTGWPAIAPAGPRLPGFRTSTRFTSSVCATTAACGGGRRGGRRGSSTGGALVGAGVSAARRIWPGKELRELYEAQQLTREAGATLNPLSRTITRPEIAACRGRAGATP